MLVNDFDDEHTLDEEEALEGENDEEIDDLQKVSTRSSSNCTLLRRVELSRH